MGREPCGECLEPLASLAPLDRSPRGRTLGIWGLSVIWTPARLQLQSLTDLVAGLVQEQPQTSSGSHGFLPSSWSQRPISTRRTSMACPGPVGYAYSYGTHKLLLAVCDLV
jgi:hypothetical protein